MKTVTLNVADQYVGKVMGMIHASPQERERIETDLREHLQAGMAAGEDLAALVERMGEPREVAAEFMAQVPMVYAGFWRRLAAFAIDFVLILLAAALGGVLAIVLSNAVPQHPVTLADNVYGGAVIAALLVSVNAIVAIILAYFPLLEWRFGRTIGKWLLRVRVLSEDGLPVGAGQALLRRLSFYFELLLFDALFIFFNPKRQRGFDILAKTVVIED